MWLSGNHWSVMLFRISWIQHNIHCDLGLTLIMVSVKHGSDQYTFLSMSLRPMYRGDHTIDRIETWTEARPTAKEMYASSHFTYCCANILLISLYILLFTVSLMKQLYSSKSFRCWHKLLYIKFNKQVHCELVKWN